MKQDDQKYTGKGGGGRLTPNKKGERRGGREKGTPNKIPPGMKKALIEVAESVGNEYNGNGLVGYFTKLAIEDPSACAKWLAKVMLIQERSGRP